VNSKPSSSQPTNAPYALLARYYDYLVGDAAPMNRHARERILRTILPTVRDVCDLGCGSGETALELARSGFAVHAVDVSPVFCRAVLAKARRAGLRIAVHCADMRDFVLPGPVHLVLAEFAALNNLADSKDLRRVFDSVAGAVAAGGWFLFDVNTPLALRTQHAQTYWVEHATFKLVQRGTPEPSRRRARLDFEWFVPAGRSWRHVRETLWNVCWTDAEIRQALRAAGFSGVRRFDGIDVRPRVPGARRGTDAYYLAHRQ
jgi:SAM-dependent methyltransferase